MLDDYQNMAYFVSKNSKIIELLLRRIGKAADFLEVSMKRKNSEYGFISINENFPFLSFEIQSIFEAYDKYSINGYI